MQYLVIFYDFKVNFSFLLSSFVPTCLCDCSVWNVATVVVVVVMMLCPALSESLDNTEQDDTNDIPDNNSDSTDVPDDVAQPVDDTDDNDEPEQKPPLR